MEDRTVKLVQYVGGGGGTKEIKVRNMADGLHLSI
jgi:hypothetical protein